MGCLKITYNQEVRQLGKNHFFLGECLEKGVTDEKKGTNLYPFGSVASHWEKEPYRFGYQGQFAEEDEETGFNHFEAREFDPKIGRWMAIDPVREFASPYNGMGNNPVRAVDPDGRDVGFFYTEWNAYGGIGIKGGIIGSQSGTAWDDAGKISYQISYLHGDLHASQGERIIGADIGYDLGVGYDGSSSTFADWTKKQVSSTGFGIFDFKSGEDFFAFEAGASVGGGHAFIKNNVEILYLGYTSGDFESATGEWIGNIGEWWVHEKDGKSYLGFENNMVPINTDIELINAGEGVWHTPSYNENFNEINSNGSN